VLRQGVESQRVQLDLPVDAEDVEPREGDDRPKPPGRIWSSSPCITSVGTSMVFRSSVKSVAEKALMPSWCAFAPPIMPWRHQF
jgi:hypothetical protein